METDTFFAKAYCNIKLHVVTGVALYFAFVTYPIYVESRDAVRLYDAFCNFSLGKFRVLITHLFYRLKHLVYSL